MAGDVGGNEGGTPVTSGVARVMILAAAVVVGALVIANAFPTSGSPLPVSSPSSTPSSHPRSHPSPHPAKVDCSKISGTQLAVENAHTSMNGLAAAVAIKLQAAGYRINSSDIKNAAADQATTSVEFRTAADRDAAKCLRKKYFAGAKLGKLSANAGVSSSVQVAVYLGADYAAKHPVH